jgi:hypothetical protein
MSSFPRLKISLSETSAGNKYAFVIARKMFDSAHLF